MRRASDNAIAPKGPCGVVERIEEDEESLFFREHQARYEFAIGHFVKGPTLDIACGTGYGARMLGERPGGLVVAADVDEPAVVAARQRYGDELLGFMIADGRKLPFGDRTFHSIVTLETLEHIDDDAAYVRELARVLHPDGTMVLSTPNRAYSEQLQRVNPYHVREYHAPELLALLQQRFRRTALFYQGFSARYEAAERSYAASIQSRKQRLPLPLRAGIDAVYRPLKRVVPRNVSNYFIRRLLGLEYPQPRPADIHISAEPDPAANVFIVVCQEPVPG